MTDDNKVPICPKEAGNSFGNSSPGEPIIDEMRTIWVCAASPIKGSEQNAGCWSRKIFLP
ncbi:MAG: hypothetical protein LBC02_10185 [Planctomycetaceae bacterium]|nr:hypothetical protein [Planctomycetaceae bacterium]